jgi:MscS family membrane protein
MRALLLGLMLLGTTVHAEDGGAPDGGRRLFDVTEAAPVKKAEAAMDKAGSGLRAALPESWQAPSVLGLERWQWLGIPALGLLIALCTLLLLRGTRATVKRLTRGKSDIGDRMLARLDGPLQVWWASLLARVTLPVLALSDGAEAGWQRAFKIGLWVAFFWGALRAVTAWSDHFATTDFAQARPGSRALVSLFGRVARFALVGFGILAVLSELGYSVTSVLAGLGIGGIALALGAQKTLENVFGAFALAVDQPIREGDFVRVEDFVGTVENIGLRSTRIRTLDRTVISIPNGKLADLRLETFAPRERIRLAMTVGLSYGTTATQLKEVLEGFHAVLHAQKTLWPDSVTVRLAGFGDSALQIEIMAWFVTGDFDDFKAIREQVLLGFLEQVEHAGTSIAYPTRTVLLAK